MSAPSAYYVILELTLRRAAATPDALIRYVSVEVSTEPLAILFRGATSAGKRIFLDLRGDRMLTIREKDGFLLPNRRAHLRRRTFRVHRREV